MFKSVLYLVLGLNGVVLSMSWSVVWNILRESLVRYLFGLVGEEVLKFMRWVFYVVSCCKRLFVLVSYGL